MTLLQAATLGRHAPFDLGHGLVLCFSVLLHVLHHAVHTLRACVLVIYTQREKQQHNITS